MSPSTAAPEKLPTIAGLRRLTKSLAMLDAIISPEWAYRYYSYNSQWGPGEEMASMRDGCGDEWFLLFDGYGAALKGFAHESFLAADGSFANQIQGSVPRGFASFMSEPAFSPNRATFCLWRRLDDPTWSVVAMKERRVSPQEDGSEKLLHLLDGVPASYQHWAENYYEHPIPFHAVQALYKHQPLSADLIHELNPKSTPTNVAADAVEIGYPLPQ